MSSRCSSAPCRSSSLVSWAAARTRPRRRRTAEWDPVPTPRLAERLRNEAVRRPYMRRSEDPPREFDAAPNPKRWPMVGADIAAADYVAPRRSYDCSGAQRGSARPPPPSTTSTRRRGWTRATGVRRPVRAFETAAVLRDEGPDLRHRSVRTTECELLRRIGALTNALFLFVDGRRASMPGCAGRSCRCSRTPRQPHRATPVVGLVARGVGPSFRGQSHPAAPADAEPDVVGLDVLQWVIAFVDDGSEVADRLPADRRGQCGRVRLRLGWLHLTGSWSPTRRGPATPRARSTGEMAGAGALRSGTPRRRPTGDEAAVDVARRVTVPDGEAVESLPTRPGIRRPSWNASTSFDRRTAGPTTRRGRTRA